MVAQSERILSLPELQKHARANKTGRIIDIHADPDTLSGIPEYLRELVRSGSSLIIDYAGGLTIHPNGQNGEKK